MLWRRQSTLGVDVGAFFMLAHRRRGAGLQAGRRTRGQEAHAPQEGGRRRQAEGRPEEVQNDEQVRAAYLGSDDNDELMNAALAA